MGVLKRAWDLSGWIVGGYTIWRQLKAMSEAKNEFYMSLSPEQQAQWEYIFGKPQIAPQMQNLPPVQVVAQGATQPSQIEQVVAGT
jgi:hypothetical protein